LKSAEQNCQPPYLLETRHDYETKLKMIRHVKLYLNLPMLRSRLVFTV
jgi:hypothetical protein